MGTRTRQVFLALVTIGSIDALATAATSASQRPTVPGWNVQSGYDRRLLAGRPGARLPQHGLAARVRDVREARQLPGCAAPRRLPPCAGDRGGHAGDLA